MGSYGCMYIAYVSDIYSYVVKHTPLMLSLGSFRAEGEHPGI